MLLLHLLVALTGSLANAIDTRATDHLRVVAERSSNAADTLAYGYAPAGAVVDDWNTCDPSADTCASSDAVCCIANGDLASSKYTCRPGSSGIVYVDLSSIKIVNCWTQFSYVILC